MYRFPLLNVFQLRQSHAKGGGKWGKCPRVAKLVTF